LCICLSACLSLSAIVKCCVYVSTCPSASFVSQ
jgi:hypothetical protein